MMHVRYASSATALQGEAPLALVMTCSDVGTSNLIPTQHIHLQLRGVVSLTYLVSNRWYIFNLTWLRAAHDR